MQSWRALSFVRALAAICLAAFLSACGDGAGGDPAVIGLDNRAGTVNCYNSADYFPLGLGDTWRYAKREWSSDGGLDEYENTQTVTGTEMIGGVEAARMEEDDDGDYNLFSNTDGIRMYGAVDFEDHGYREECTYEPPIQYAPAVMCVGKQHSFSSDVRCEAYERDRHVGSSSAHGSGTLLLERVEDITVPAGRFDNSLKFRLTRRVSVSGDEVEYAETSLWLARGVGRVKWSEEGFAPGDEGGTPIETDDDELVSARVGGIDYPSGSPQGGPVSGTIMYTGSHGPVSSARPIGIFLHPDAYFEGTDITDMDYVGVNGGSFELNTTAAGNYYLMYFLDEHNDGKPNIGEPFEIFDNRLMPPGDPVTPPRSGLSLGFSDDYILWGFAGTVTYTGGLGPVSPARKLRVEASTGPDVDVVVGSAEVDSNGGRYDLFEPPGTYYLRAYLDVNDNGEFDAGEPFEIYDNKCAPPADALAPGPAQTGIDFAFGDENTGECRVDTATPTATATRTPTPTPTRTPTVTPTRLVTCAGDADCDAQLTAADVDATIRALFDPIARALCSTDCDEDGAVGAADILCASNHFVAEAECVRG